MNLMYRYIAPLVCAVFAASPSVAERISITESAFDESYRCAVKIKSGLDKENGRVSHYNFALNDEVFFVTHTSDFSERTLDGFLTFWNVDEEYFDHPYSVKSDGVSHTLFDEESSYVYDFQSEATDNLRVEVGSYWFRAADNDPKNRWSWKQCSASSRKSNEASQITCDLGDVKLFQMNADTKEFTYSYLGTMHDPKGNDGYEGDSAVVMHGTCKPYYP